MTEAQVIKALGALAQETRLRIFRQLVVAGPQGLTPTQLSEALNAAPTALSFHLKELSQAGLAYAQRDGRHLIYRADVDTMNTLLGFLTENCCGGEPCLAVPLTASSGCGC
ncbi:ArsR/SmtB family transcription factor [Tepidicella xavieri]|jgi:DNA-binding transcriptional ArsR family regulator|uniref:ArsR family transcriptional regulator n=1 Tax=Tepidicella xavieri TaxID=360241 RepID=A0A4R6U6B6_9BURK|nr:metalloregulator ArsR/SmtB family transcription factor [Tepidicella xavieri]TDQ41801.1 ArsR family transcriptional regulator [Tepidicella xavieri]